MKNRRYTRKWIRVTAYLMTAGIIFSQAIVSMATEDSFNLEYITDIMALSERDTDLTFEEKPSSEDLQDVFPDTLTVVLDGKSDTTEIEVDWECETDYESEWTGKGQESYTFLPKWDESAYVLTDAEIGRIEIPVITVSIEAEEKISPQIEDLEAAQEDLQVITGEKSILALVYLCDQYEVRDNPSEDGGTVVSVVSGQSVQIEDVELDQEGNVWYKVSLYQQDKNYTGYIEKKYLATSDEIFLDWSDEYVDEKKEEVPVKKIRTMSAATASDYPDIVQFPASYQNSLLALKRQYPNWIFVKMETGLNFNTAVANEMKNDRSWISSSNPASWQNGAAKQSGWSLASEGILRYYMDPRNFLTESAIFQFEQLTYNASYHTESAVQAIVASSFMAGNIPDENMTYAKAFTQIGEELKISPFHLASRVLQEQGTNGTSPLISGKYRGFEGYYNYFNVGASGKDAELYVKGLTEAKSRGWDTRYKSLYGGAAVIGQNYILKGQDTLYLQKFNVTSNDPYNHQYMQNIMAPASEASNIRRAYSNTGSLNNSFVFKVPVYSNMPASACVKPDTTDTITLNKSTISSLAVDRTEKLIPYVNGSKVDSVSGMTFTSSNTGAATVDSQGLIKAISPGTATITCARSGAKSASCTVTVVKAEPIIDTPVLSPAVYKRGLMLADIDLPEGWSWSSGNTLLEAGTASYPADYIPADTTRYLTVTRQIGLKVSQAIPSCIVPEKLTAKLGSKLGSIELPTGFSWESDEETILDKAGEKTFYLSYDPNDKNYLEMNHIPVIVKVIDDNIKLEDPDDQGGSLPDGDSGNSEVTGGSGSGGGMGAGGSGSGMVSSGNTGSSGSTNTGSTSKSDITSTGSTGNSDSTSTDTTSSGSTNSNNANSNSSQKNNDTVDNDNVSSDTEDDNGSGDTDTSAGNSNVNSDSNDNGQTDNSVTSITDGGGVTSGSTNNNNNKQSRASGNITAGSNHSTLLVDSDSATEAEAGEVDAEDKEEPVYERPAVTMDMEDVPILTAEMLQMAKDQNVDLLLKMNDRVSWYVNVGTVQGNISDIDMNVLFERNVIPEDLLAAWAQENEYLEFTLAHDGPFSFGAELKILLNPEDSGRYANLFYYDSETDTLEFMCARVIDENGYAVFPMEHASSYVIIISDYPMTDMPMPETNTEADSDPDSSSGRIVFGIILLAVLAVSGTTGYFYLRKRREEDECYDADDEEDGDIDEDEADKEDGNIDEDEEDEKADKMDENAEIMEEDNAEYIEDYGEILEEETSMAAGSDEDDWIEDEEWQEPEEAEVKDPFADDHAEDDWIGDDEWDISNDWMDDEEWEKKSKLKKTAV